MLSFRNLRIILDSHLNFKIEKQREGGVIGYMAVLRTVKWYLKQVTSEYSSEISVCNGLLYIDK